MAVVSTMTSDELFEAGIQEARRLLVIINIERDAIGPLPVQHQGRDAIVTNALFGLGDIINFFEDQHKRTKQAEKDNIKGGFPLPF